MTNDFYKNIAEYYNTDAEDYDSRYWSNYVLQRMRQLFREEVKRHPSRNMLEIGYGTGIDLLHFARIFPERILHGIDISDEMYKISSYKITESKIPNIIIKQGRVEDIPFIFPEQKFEIIYVFFGALNTTRNLQVAADTITEALVPGGILVLSFVNKWYLGGIFIDMLRFRFNKALGRLKPVWGGYSPHRLLPGICYTPNQVVKTFKKLTLYRKQGYCIVHPAWFYTGVNHILRPISNTLWFADRILNKTFMWRFGEYALLVFKK